VLLPPPPLTGDRASRRSKDRRLFDGPLARTARGRSYGLAILAAGLAFAAAPGIARAAEVAQTEACFSPRLPGDCDPSAMIVQAINAARASILVQAYEITADPIVNALVKAHRRGVDVRAIVDYKQLTDRRYHDDARAVQALRAAGITVLVDRPRGLDPERAISHYCYALAIPCSVPERGWSNSTAACR
jgi:phosphatidylserine/phosphatidylglycerophosphate/cardiolipin synthase-like enzyme